MNRRRLGPWLLVLAVVVMWFCLRGLKRQTVAGPGPAVSRPAPAAKPIDLTKHDGAAIDFSSGWPVVKDTPADRAAVAQAVKEMDEATKDVTFEPAPPKTPDKPPAPPAKQ